LNYQRLRFVPALSQRNVAPPAIRDTFVEGGLEAAQRGQRIFAPLGAIALGMAVMFALLWMFGALATPLASLIGASLACAAGLIVISKAHYERLLGRFFTFVVLLVFVVKIAIGVAHYLYFFEPNYFSRPLGFFPWIYDYAQLPEGMQAISSFWHTYGFVDVPMIQIVFKSWILAVYHALLYYLNGAYLMNFIPWASFHTLLVGFLVSSLALQRGATPRQATAAFILAGLQPLYLYTDLPQRDIVGQFFIVLAVYLVVYSLDKPSRLVLVLPIVLVLVYALRWAYPYVLLMFILLAYLLAKRRAGFAIVLLGISIVVWSIAGPLIDDLTIGKYNELPTTSIARFPAAVLVGIVGPFPWTQVFDVQDAFIHLPPIFLQAWLGAAIWLIVLPRLWGQWQTARRVDELALASFLFALSGITTQATHSGYVHIATVLLLPMVCKTPVREWASKIAIVFYLYLFGHLAFYSLGLAGRNLFIR